MSRKTNVDIEAFPRMARLLRDHRPWGKLLLPLALVDALESHEDETSRHFPDKFVHQTKDVLPELPATSRTKRPKRTRTPRHPLFDPREVEALSRYLEGFSKTNERRAVAAPMLRLADIHPDGRVPLAVVTTRIAERLNRLKAEMPNFSPVIDTIGPALQLQRAGDRSLRMPPLLLIGSPGIGKSYFAQRLAEALGLYYASVSLETATAGWTLTGASMTWSSGGPGIVFRTLVQGATANPLILLDEVDKVSSDLRYSPLNALHGLLEPITASRFHDEALDSLTIDASAINWVLTANEKERIPATLLSRALCFNAASPTMAERRNIVEVVYRDMRAKEPWGRKFSPALCKRTLDVLASLEDSVRGLKRVMKHSCAIAYASGRRSIDVTDVLATTQRPGTKVDLVTVEPCGTA